MVFNPYEYQRIMRAWMLTLKRCAIWAGMGLGKTSTVLSALDLLYLAGEDRPTLVLAPLRVARSTWPKEVDKWDDFSHISMSPIIGTAEQRLAALRKDASVYTLNYENLPWLLDQYRTREQWPFRTVIADESTKLKSFRGSNQVSTKGKAFVRAGGSKRATALARVAHLYADRFVELTGTPSPNGLKDLWGQMWFIDGGQRLGRTYESFIQRWFQKSFDGFSVDPLPFAQEQIQDKLTDVCLSIKTEDWFDIDEPIRRTIYVDLPSKARRIYKQMEKDMFAQIGGKGIEAPNAAAKTIKCLQLANGAAYTDDKGKDWHVVHDEKIQALDEVIEEAAGMPVIVVYHFKSDLARLKKAFKQGRELGNDTKVEDAWNAGKVPILFVHAASAGHGLNLQDGGNIIAFFGHWWDLEQYQQVIERIGPIRQVQSGHPRAVYIYHIVARNTVDDIVMARRESKREVQDLLIEYMKRKDNGVIDE